jgi:hypothetical protein
MAPLFNVIDIGETEIELAYSNSACSAVTAKCIKLDDGDSPKSDMFDSGDIGQHIRTGVLFGLEYSKPDIGIATSVGGQGKTGLGK